MKNLMVLGAVLLGFCAVHPVARAGDDGPDYNYQRSEPRYYEGRVVEPRCYLPPPPPVFLLPPPPRVIFYGRPHYRPHRYPYAYGYGCAPGVRIGIGL